MVAPFNQAWMLLKQRGHELNLPPPRIMGDNPARSLSPQDLTDRRVDEATMARRLLDNFESFAANSRPSISSTEDAIQHLHNRKFDLAEMERNLRAADTANAHEAHFERMQGDLDRQTLARMGQQPEADEMEAMGVPPMSRTLGGTPPANLGRAGSTGEIPRSRQRNAEEMGMFGMDALDDAGMDLEFDDDMSSAQRQQLIDKINQNIEPSNPFPKPIGQNVRGDLMDWAAGAGREASVPDIVERTEYYDEDGNLRTDLDELSDMHDDDMYEEIHGEPLDENNPAKHTIASTTLRASPRQQRRGQTDSGRPYFKKPDREGPIGMSPSRRAMKLLQRNAAN
jgi:hypothetical protein